MVHPWCLMLLWIIFTGNSLGITRRLIYLYTKEPTIYMEFRCNRGTWKLKECIYIQPYFDPCKITQTRYSRTLCVWFCTQICHITKQWQRANLCSRFPFTGIWGCENQLWDSWQWAFDYWRVLLSIGTLF